MLYIDFKSAWDVYTSVCELLPDFPAPVDPCAVSGVLEVADDYDVVLFDAYGVLHVGGAAFPSSLRAIGELQKQGKPFAVLTNDVTKAPEILAAQLRERGYVVGPEAIVSARLFLREAVRPFQGQKIGLLASRQGDARANYPGFSLLVPGDDQSWESCSAVVFIDNNDWTSWKTPEWFRDRMRQSPKPIFLCNPDVACPYRGRMTAEPGFFAFQAVLETGAPLYGLGKPFPEVYRAALARFPAIPPHRMLMVGDTPHTDVLGARSAGMDCLLTTCGFLKGEDVWARCKESGLLPNFIAECL